MYIYIYTYIYTNHSEIPRNTLKMATIEKQKTSVGKNVEDWKPCALSTGM